MVSVALTQLYNMRRRLYLFIVGFIGFIAMHTSVAVNSYAAETPVAQQVSYARSSTSISSSSNEIAQLPSLGNDALDSLAWGFIASELMKAIDGGVPVVANTRDVYPTVNELPSEPVDLSTLNQLEAVATVRQYDKSVLSQPFPAIGQLPRVRNQNRQNGGTGYEGTNQVSEGAQAFIPTGDSGGIVAQMRQSVDGSVTLEPGDYEIPMTLFCMKQRASSPPGHRYILAPLQGSRASVIAALNANAAGQDIDYGPLQELSWSIQAGLAYSDMSEASQSLVDQLIPSYKSQLRGSFLDEIESTYNTVSGFTNLPSFDSALNQLGVAGQVIREYQQFRDTLLRHQNDYDQLLTTLIPTSRTTSAIGGAERTPWSRIDNQVYARMITQGSAGERGRLQIRVLPVRTPAGLVLSAVNVAINNIIADSETEDVQSVTGVPQTPSEPFPDSDTVPAQGGERDEEVTEEREESSEGENTAELPSPSDPIPDDPTMPPGEDWEWRGNGDAGSDRGAWVNTETGETLHPDLNHGPPIGPHWDYKDREGNEWRIFPGGRQEPK